MDKILSIKNIREKGRFKKILANLLLGTGNIGEILLIALVWYLIFSDRQSFGGFSMEEVFTYIFLGAIIGMFCGYFLYKVIQKDLRGGNADLLARKPLYYLKRIFKRNLGKIVGPFILYVLLNLLLLHFLAGKPDLSIGIIELSVFLIMIILAFFTEYLLAYFINLNVFWTIESENFYLLLIRLKKIMAGAFFPLNILQEETTFFFLLLPFAYSFYVPTQLLLGHIPAETGMRGLLIQSIWLIIIYLLVKKSKK